LARLQGVVMRHGRWTPLDGDKMAAAVAEVNEILGDRDDGPELPGRSAADHPGREGSGAEHDRLCRS